MFQIWLQVRLKLNSLTQAFRLRSEEHATSHSVHKLTLGVFALNNALDHGVPFNPQKAALQKSCADDPLISLAVDSLPETDQVGLVIRTCSLPSLRMKEGSQQLQILQSEILCSRLQRTTRQPALQGTKCFPARNKVFFF